MPVDLESSFLKMVEDGRNQRKALQLAMSLLRRFQSGDPAVWMDASKAMPDLEVIEARSKEIDATDQ